MFFFSFVNRWVSLVFVVFICFGSLCYVFGVQLPWLEAELKQCEVIVGSAVAVYLFHRTISTILKGGIGKNGSSIAVSLHEFVLPVPSLFFCFEIYFL